MGRITLEQVVRKELVENILKTDSTITQEVNEALSSYTSNIDLLLKLCRVITNKITIFERQQINRYTQEKYTAYIGRRHKDIDEIQEQELMVYGTQLIYVLRSFFIGTNINFLYGATDKKGKTVSAKIPQEVVLKNLSTVVKNKAIGLTGALQNSLISRYKGATTRQLSNKRQDLWGKILELTMAEQYNKTKQGHRVVLDKTKSAHWAYQQAQNDKQVYIAFFGANKTKQLYYNKNGQKLYPFNRGWLWEWYQSFYYNAEDSEYLAFEKEVTINNSISYIIGDTDFIRGTRQGDFTILRTGKQGQWREEIQAKYKNTKIISYNNIREIILQLTQLLETAQISPQLAQEEATNFLSKHFIPEASRLGQKTVEDYVENFIKILDNPKKK